MSWSGGCDIADRMIKKIKETVEDPKVRAILYEELMESLTDQDFSPYWDDYLGIDDEVFLPVAKKVGRFTEEEWKEWVETYGKN